MHHSVENEVRIQEDIGDDEIGDKESVLLKVAGLYASHLLSDIILVVNEHRYPAHRVILSASSDVFQCMLLNPQWQESKESVIHLKEDPQSSRVFPKFLKYLYTGQVRVSIDSAMPLLSLADKYNIKDLIILCRDYMLRNIAIAGQQGFLISWLQYTLSFSYHNHLSNELKNFLRLNIDIVGFSRDFIDLDPNNLVVLVRFLFKILIIQ
jgi:BTB/POZ domain-containing protein 17